MTKSNLTLTRLVGTQEQMGTQHGSFASEDARRLFAFYRTMPERALAGNTSAVERFVVRQLATAWQASLARTRPEELRARTRAFVKAAAPEASFREKQLIALTMATMDSMQNCVSVAARARLGPFTNALTAHATTAAIPACSTVVAWGNATEDGALMFGRNFDFPGVGVWDAMPAFTVCCPAGATSVAAGGQAYGFFGARGADAPVVTVINEAGLVIAPHTRWHRDVTWSGAMIVDLVHDIARRAETLDDAIRIAKERPASSSWGICVGSAREKSALVLELAGPHVEIVRPRGDYLVCTNRYRNEAMQQGQLAASHAWSHHSDHRESRLRALVEARTRPLGLGDLVRFLGDREHAGARRRFGSVVAQPTNVHCVAVAPANRQAIVGIDRAPTCEGRVVELAWDWTGPVGSWQLASHAGSGFTATLAEHVAPHDPATIHTRDAVRVFEHSHDLPAARAGLDRAIAAAPDDPSLRLAAAWLALEARADRDAVGHVRAGLAMETEPYRRGQLLVCGARAADPRQQTQWLDDLDRHQCDGIDELRRRARRRAPLKTNLLMADAF